MYDWTLQLRGWAEEYGALERQSHARLSHPVCRVLCDLDGLTEAMSEGRAPGMTVLKVILSSEPGVKLTNPHLLRPSSVQLHPPSGSATRCNPSPIMHLKIEE